VRFDSTDPVAVLRSGTSTVTVTLFVQLLTPQSFEYGFAPI